MTAATAFMAKEGRAQGADGLFRVDEDGGGKRKVSLLDAKVGLALVGASLGKHGQTNFLAPASRGCPSPSEIILLRSPK